MASSTQIGTGAVILTANADKLLTGLDKARAATDKWAARTSKTAAKAMDATAPKGGGGAGGGLLGGVLGGAVLGGPVGAGIALAASAAKALVSAIGAIPSALAELKDASGQGSGGPLDGMIKSCEALVKAGAVLIARVVSPLAPAFDKLLGAATQVWDALGPMFDSIGGHLGMRALAIVNAVVGVFGSWWGAVKPIVKALAPIVDALNEIFDLAVFIGSELIQGVAKAFYGVVQQVTEWAASFIDVGNASDTAVSFIFAGLRAVGKEAAELWDTFKVGVAIVSAVASAITRVIATLVDVMASGIERVLRLAAAAAAAKLTGNAGLGRAIGAVADGAGGIGDSLRAAADGMDRFARAAVEGIGETAGAIDGAIDGLQGRWNAMKKLVGDNAHVEGALPTLSGAQAFGSTGAFSLIAKNNVLGQVAGGAVDRQQLNELKKLNVGVQKVAQGFGNGFVIGVI